MPKISAILWMIFIYPTLIGAGLKWMIPICLVLSGIVVYLSVRLTTSFQGKIKHVRYLGFLFAAWLGLSPVLGFIAEDFYRGWVYSIRNDSCGVKVGMTKTEVERLANSCGQAKEHSEGYLLKPRGVAILHMTFSGGCGLTIRYDGQGNVSQVNGWCD